MREFLKTSLAFTLGLLCVLVVTEQILHFRFVKTHGHGLIGPEIYTAVQKAQDPSQAVHTIYLGDSVAHQLFPPGAETRSDERFLTCNQAISLAGQCYLLEDSLRTCPNLKEVYLFYYPGSFANDLAPPLTNDYFCEFFHRPGQIREVFSVTKDFHLAAAQTGRFLLPSILGMNSGSRPATPINVATKQASGASTSGDGSEPLLDALDKIWGTPRHLNFAPQYDDQGRRLVVLSPVSHHYLKRIQDLCAEHHLALHVLPCPCSDAQPFVDTEQVYHGPILYVDATHFGDAIHLRKQYLADVRHQITEIYQLIQPAPTEAALGIDVGRALPATK